MDPVLYVATIVQGAINWCSIGTNGFLLFVILKNRNLRISNCNWFILILAFCDCATAFSTGTLPVILTIANISLPVLTCFYLIFYGPMLQIYVAFLMFLVSLDRFIAITFPFCYKMRLSQKKCYIAFFAAIPFPAIFYYLFAIYTYDRSQPNKMSFCMPSDFQSVELNQEISYAFTFFNISTMTIYAGIWLRIKLKYVALPDNEDRRLFRSLMLMMLVTFFFWLPASLYTSFFHGTSTLQIILHRALNMLQKFGQVLHAPILFICSKEYREAAKRLWRTIFNLSAERSSSGAVGPATIAMNHLSR